MALKKRKKISSKKLRVDKASEPDNGDENFAENTDESGAGAESSGKEKNKPEQQSTESGSGKPPSKPKPGGSGSGGGSGKGGGKSQDKNREVGGFAGYYKFLKDVLVEYRKITWPDRHQIVKETWSVLVLVTFITFLVLGYDFVLGKVFGYIEHLAKIYVGS